ncbi:hypothetical protein ACLKA7_006860 [Drosophila subpalustris]
MQIEAGTGVDVVVGGSASVDSQRNGFVLELRRFNAGGRRSVSITGPVPTSASMSISVTSFSSFSDCACPASVPRLMPCCSDICRLAMGRGIAVADNVTEADVVNLGGGGASNGCGTGAAAPRKQDRVSG